MKSWMTTTLAALMVIALVDPATAAPKKEYPPCTEGDVQSYFGALTNELQQCKKSTKFDITEGSLPTPDQRSAVCKCKSLIEKLPYIAAPRCKIALDNNRYNVKIAMESIFSDCGSIVIKEVPPPTVKPGASGSGSDATATDAPETKKPTVTEVRSTSDVASNATSDAASASSASEETEIEPSTEASKEEEVTEAPEPTTTKPAAPKNTAVAVAVSTSAALLVASAFVIV